jgi:hypothetical protein
MYNVNCKYEIYKRSKIMKRVVLLMLAVLIISISMYGDIGKGDWTQDEINYFKTKEYIGNKKFYSIYKIKYYPPYIIEMTLGEFVGYGHSDIESLSKLIIIGKLDMNAEFRYLSLLRNEMYARNGYIFKDARLKAVFNQMPWYKPISEDVQLNGYERTNIRAIKRLEKGIKDIVAIQEPNPDTLPEKYVSKVIIDAKWGKKEGEFALAGESPVYGPEPMIIDKEGNIYISDQGNKRIVKYNSKGELIMNYYYFKNEKPKDAKWGKGGNIIGIKDSILYTKLNISAGKIYIISININTGDIINKVHYDSIKYNKELSNLIFYGSNTEYIIDETGKFKRTDVEKKNIYLNSTLQNIINKNYPLNLGELGGILYIGSDSLKNNYYIILIGNYVCIYKFSEQNNLLAYIRISANDYMDSNGYLFNITSSGDIHFLYSSGKVFIKDWKQKFIPGKIQLIKWSLQN